MGTFIYRAPELLRGYVPSTKSDMFSFSITGKLLLPLRFYE